MATTMTATSVNRLNWNNIALMILSAAAAAVAPFHLFLFAYAVLGPLHYLTEVSWLHDRKFFTSTRFHRGLWLSLVAVATAVMMFGYIANDLMRRPISPAFEIGMFLLVFVAASVASFVRHPVNAVALVSLAVVGVFVFSTNAAYGILAYLLITIVHVFVFTAVFILSGAMKTKSRSGYVSFAVFLACAAATLIVHVPFVTPGARVRETYAAFEPLNQLLLRFSAAPTHDVYNPAAAGVMRFVAFAYIYHYLNWFSKTSIIRWHEVSRARGAAIVGGWLGGIALYAYNYRAGFAVFYVLSVIHVMLEFPLNHQTVVSVLRSLAPLEMKEAARGRL
ncbi:MAG TPA: hypothetical protein VF824_13690 [Thermoanaerobaculia bacterium]|jgi:hypothetical protein